MSSEESKAKPKEGKKLKKPKIEKTQPERKEGSISQDLKSGGDDKGWDLDMNDAKSEPGVHTSCLKVRVARGDEVVVDVVSNEVNHPNPDLTHLRRSLPSKITLNRLHR